MRKYLCVKRMEHEPGFKLHLPVEVLNRMKTALIKKALVAKRQVMLDLGCGDHKMEGFIGMDRRKRPGVDVVHDVEDLPWPFKDETFNTVAMSHLMEHLNPKYTVEIMNEIWRITKPGGHLMIAMPYAGSFGFWQDPTHIHAWNEATPTYFDPNCALYDVYKPLPWQIKDNIWRSDGNIEVCFIKTV